MDVLLSLGTGDGLSETLERTLDRTRACGDSLTIAIIGGQDDRGTVEANVKERLAETDREIRIRHVGGDRPGSQIVELAETGGYDRIILPSGQRSSLRKIQFDDVIEFVLVNATMTVTLLR